MSSHPGDPARRILGALAGLSVLSLVAACNERAPEPPTPLMDAEPATSPPPASPAMQSAIPDPDAPSTAAPPPGEAVPTPTPPTLPPDPNEPPPPDPMNPTAPRAVPPDGV
jgi:hypothetical protein